MSQDVTTTPKLLFITDKVHAEKAFVVLWVKGFVDRGYEVTVLVLEDRSELAGQALGQDAGSLPFVVASLGKERGYSKLRQALRFVRLVATLDYDRVLIHMMPIWGVLGAWSWIPRRVPVYLWYTHYTMELGIWALGHYGRRLFCATAQSLPQYHGSPKRVVTGHGIDLSYWPQRPSTSEDAHRLLCVHRLSPSKRADLLLRALVALPPSYTLDVYGYEPDGGTHAAELRGLVGELGLGNRVSFHGEAAAKDLPAIYARYRLILNMATETIDKTMLEAMTCGCYPVVTRRNAEAIGLPAAPDDDPSAIATFVDRYAGRPPLAPDELFAIVRERHSLKGLIGRLDAYIRPGR